MERVIVALTGKAGSGKSTAAEGLARDHGFVRVRFADPLKNMLRSLYRDAGLDEAEIERRIEGDLKEVPCEVLCGRTPRQAMQWLGTEWGRNMVAPDFWTRLWTRRAKRHARVVVEDCRFENEAQTVRRARGLIVRVERPGLAPIAAGGHVSEAGGVDADALVENGGPKESLWKRVALLIQPMIAGG